MPGVLQQLAAPAGSSLPPPRVLVVLAHADDEVLALGARLERLTHSRLLTVTDGAPADGSDARHHGFSDLASYRAARREELAAALAHAGLPPHIARPFRDQVPDQAAALHLVTLSHCIAREIEAFAPNGILTHPYEGGHPDHDACAFAVHSAVRLLNGSRPPAVLEAPFYHAGPGGSMVTGSFLDYPGAGPALICELTAEEQANKRARLACFVTQTETLSLFSTERELFRLAPAYDFTQPPHPGKLLYEHFPWGMSGDRFRALAARAAAELPGTLSRSHRPGAFAEHPA